MNAPLYNLYRSSIILERDQLISPYTTTKKISQQNNIQNNYTLQCTHGYSSRQMFWKLSILISGREEVDEPAEHADKHTVGHVLFQTSILNFEYANCQTPKLGVKLKRPVSTYVGIISLNLCSIYYIFFVYSSNLFFYFVKYYFVFL